MRSVAKSQACWCGSSEIAEVLIAWYVVRVGEASYSEKSRGRWSVERPSGRGIKIRLSLSLIKLHGLMT